MPERMMFTCPGCDGVVYVTPTGDEAEVRGPKCDEVVYTRNALFDLSDSEDRWYFAYGSNMSIDRKTIRTGTIRQKVVVCLNGYRLAFNKRANNAREAYANVVPSPGDEVWGVAYRCNSEAIEQLDRHEGVSGGHYHRQQVDLKARLGETLQAEVYIAGEAHVVEETQPSDEYLGHLLEGAANHHLPDDYIAMIKRIARRSN